jgi:hypothetical protein
MRRGRKTKPVSYRQNGRPPRISNAEGNLLDYLPARKQILQSEVDSLNRLLKEKEAALAEIQDVLAAMDAPLE